MNSEVLLTVDDAVDEVLGLLTGLDLEYDPEQDRYRSIVRQLNRALRANALENEWGYYSERQQVGVAQAGQRVVYLTSSKRPRIINDDAVTLVNSDGEVVRWAYFLPRDALHKYEFRDGLWCSHTYREIQFSRDFWDVEDGLAIYASVMREPIMIRLPDTGVEVPDSTRNQEIDFEFPDAITTRAAYYYAMTDPIMQPRAQTLEGMYKDYMYQLIERDTRHTDMPYTNEFVLPVQNGLMPESTSHRHPHSNF